MIVDYLQRFSSLSAEQREGIVSAFYAVEAADGHYLFSGAQVCRQLYFVCNGILRILSIDDTGKDVTHFFMREQMFCTILDSFLHQKVSHDRIQAVCDANLLAISFADLETLQNRFPELRILFADLFQRQLLEKVALRNAYQNLDALSRYQLFLKTQPDVALRVKMHHVASYLGIAPQSLSRLRRQIS